MKPVHWEETQTPGHIWTNVSLLSTEEVLQMKSRGCNFFVHSMVELFVKLPLEQIVCMYVCMYVCIAQLLCCMHSEGIMLTCYSYSAGFLQVLCRYIL